MTARRPSIAALGSSVAVAAAILAAVWVLPSHERAAPIAPSEVLRAAVPWAEWSVATRAGVPRTWTFRLRNPLDREVTLASPTVRGCARCVSADWAPGAGPLRLGPGDEGALVVRYTGAVSQRVQRYALCFSVVGGEPPVELRVPLEVTLSSPAPVESADLSLSVVAGSQDPLSVPWRGPDGWSARAVGTSRRDCTVLAILGFPLGEGGRRQLTLVPLAPWAPFQTGVLHATFSGWVTEWTAPWRCIGRPPFSARILEPEGGGGRTLLLDSHLEGSSNMALLLSTGSDPVERSEFILEGGSRLHVPLPTADPGAAAWCTVLCEEPGFESRLELAR